ncbi:gliding motility protein GldL [Candidatus Amoebophilus asiaticus]|nr:gliding motility protein GldL [Candidatus Amoebophilus asiaticus]
MKNFMAKLYGWGASLVITGAMFKIMHWPGAGVMLVTGLSTEAIIFFFSAFEKPHEEVDWALVYPELAHAHEQDDFGLDEDDGEEETEYTGTVSQQLDQMMEEAKVGPELIGSLGTGLRTFSNNISKMVDLTDSSVITNEFNENIKQASGSLENMNTAYTKGSTAMNELADASSDVQSNLSNIASSTSNYAGSMETAATSLDEINNSYSKTVDAMNELASTSTHTKDYNDQVQAMAKNLSSLNSLYEMEMQDSNRKLLDTINELNATNEATRSYNDQMKELTSNLGSLNSLYTTEIADSTTHLNAMKEFYGGMSAVMENINASVEDTKKYKHEIAQLTQNLSTLNAVYGNMLSAMRVPAANVGSAGSSSGSDPSLGDNSA